MVNVYKPTLEEKALEKEYPELERITKKAINGISLNDMLKPTHMGIYKDKSQIAVVDLIEKLVLVQDKESYKELYSLTEDFELETQKQWTIQRNY